MKLFSLFIFILIPFYGLTQTLELREKITQEFKEAPVPKIELFNISSISTNFDSIQLKSEYLAQNKINIQILSFVILGIDAEGKSKFKLTSRGNIIPKDFKEKFDACRECKSVKIEQVTIKWFTGTYTVLINEIWEIK